MNVSHVVTKLHHKIINDLYETNTVVNKMPNILLKGYINKHTFKMSQNLHFHQILSLNINIISLYIRMQKKSTVGTL